jgi:uncharacterized protein (DUF58 family)
MPSRPPEPSDQSPVARPGPVARPLDPRGALVMAAAGGALILAALAFGAAPLFVPGLASLLLAAVTPAWLLLAARSAHLERRLVSDRVVEDEPIEATVVVRRGVLGLPGGEVRDSLVQGPVPLEGTEVSPLPGHRRLELRVVTRHPRRGRHRFDPPSLSLTDPLGLVRVLRQGGGAPSDVLVLPRVEPVIWKRPEHRRTLSGEASRLHQEPIGAGEIDGIRRYMPGTPASRIHWPALARGAGLMERRLVAEPEAQPLIVLDPRTDGSLDGERRLDAAVRATASLILSLARSGGCSILLPGESMPLAVERDLAAWPGIHTRLALVDREANPRRSPRLRHEPGRGAVLYVAAGVPGASPAWPRGSDGARVILVVPADARALPDTAPSFEVAGCLGFAFGGRRTERGRAA